MLLIGSVASRLGGGSLRSGALELAVPGGSAWLAAQAAGRYGLVDESGTGCGALDRLAKLDHGRVCAVGRCSLVAAPVRSVLVVVVDELGQKSLELSLVPDQGAVEEFVADGANPSLGERVRLGRARGCLDRFGADCGEHVVEGAGVLAAAVSDHEAHRLSVGHREVAAAWVVQGPVGLVVIPARWTRRVSISMKNRT